MDLHAGQIQGFFSKPVDHMTSMGMLTQYFRDMRLDDLVVVSPDAGRVKLAKKFAEKGRRRAGDPQQGAPGPAGRRDRHVIGDVKDKTAVIIDDIIDTAGTLRAAAEDGQVRGGRRIFAAATHPVLSGRAFENLAASAFEQSCLRHDPELRPWRARRTSRS
jgi:ribose-phosphate pyrophosphokinase